ncbi:hypothetical protein PGT21_035377 [Puccinia graminis f. sp. tritici]|uniref:Uncharacterized protein n=1 Tax=Puccinia graminis f. sp. tritici TaxID=56615 RepID=A0A5B0MA75_PUCGR|nr:hypothetical protein PGTUg99_025476 [Puccinia graminis f. sp. tritici]KAA1084785.1 hypothetical protein PGT21_035377 [Puccinia graminis f. sp. tritici]
MTVRVAPPGPADRTFGLGFRSTSSSSRRRDRPGGAGTTGPGLAEPKLLDRSQDAY